MGDGGQEDENAGNQILSDVRMNQEELLSLRILIVDDEPVNIALLEDILQFSGYRTVESTTDPRRVMGLCKERRPDLVLLDLNMPFIDGFGVLKLLSAEYPHDECLPILVLTADVGLETKRRALAAGATDFLTKPFDTVEVLLRIKNLLRTRHQHLQLSDQKTLLEDSVRARTAELRHTLSQLQQAQGQMIQQERLSALGAMTAGIAHDFNNTLSLILGYSEMLTRLLQRPEGITMAGPLLGTVITAAQDAAKMFNRLRDFYRPVEKGQPRALVDLNALVEQAAALTRPRWHGQALGQGVTIQLATDLAPDLPRLLADAAELREMLTNLIFNAVDAMPQGGTITLRTRHEAGSVPDEGLREAGVERPVDDDSGSLVLEVADTGTGMDEETCRRCLEPFFTTKGTRGTGLGLAMVYGTVQRHGGSIELESRIEEGTRFSLHLPLRPPAAREAAADNAPLAEQPPRRVLVVDDQEVLCEILVEYLAGGGHTVETALNGAEALAKFRATKSGGGYELVITDRAMPGMNGEQLAAEVKRLAPDTRVILLTGYATPGESGLPPANIDLVVDKPVSRETLNRAMAQVMDGAELAEGQGVDGVGGAPLADRLEHAVGW